MKGILLDENNDLLLGKDGIQLGDTQEQETRLILISVPGNWKESPLLGIDLYSEINDTTSAGALKSRIRKQLKSDGKSVDRIDFDGSKLIIE